MRINKFIRIDENTGALSKKSLADQLSSASLFLEQVGQLDRMRGIMQRTNGQWSAPNNFGIGTTHDPFSSDLGQSGMPHIEEVWMPGSYEWDLLVYLANFNHLILKVKSDLAKRKVGLLRIQEFEHDIFKAVLKTLRGLFLRKQSAILSFQQLCLAVIHLENSSITLENFLEEKIGDQQKIFTLRKECQSMIAVAEKMKNSLLSR